MLKLQAEHQTDERDLSRCSASTLAAARARLSATSTTVTVDGTLSGEGTSRSKPAVFRRFQKGNQPGFTCATFLPSTSAAIPGFAILLPEGVDLTANDTYSSYIVDEIQSAGLGKRRNSR